ncbi:MAG: DUF3325 domain-containing protein [Pseudomonadota bacterium]
MHEAALLLGVFAAAYVGFAALALSLDRHWYDLGGGRECPVRTAWLLRIVGYGLLLAALVVALIRDGAGFGSLLWGTMITIGAVAVVATLSWRARWLKPLVRLCKAIG